MEDEELKNEKNEAKENTQTETKAESKETTPVMDFEKTEEYPDDYEKNSKEVLVMF